MRHVTEAEPEYLARVVEVTGELQVDYTSLHELPEMPCLREVGSLSISNNSQLSSLAGLESLERVHDEMLINKNKALSSLGGLEGLQTIGSVWLSGQIVDLSYPSDEGPPTVQEDREAVVRGRRRGAWRWRWDR